MRLTDAQVALLEAAVAWEQIGEYFYPLAGPPESAWEDVWSRPEDDRHWKKFSPATLSALRRKRLLKKKGSDKHGARYEVTDLGLKVFVEIFDYEPW